MIFLENTNCDYYHWQNYQASFLNSNYQQIIRQQSKALQQPYDFTNTQTTKNCLKPEIKDDSEAETNQSSKLIDKSKVDSIDKYFNF